MKKSRTVKVAQAAAKRPRLLAAIAAILGFLGLRRRKRARQDQPTPPLPHEERTSRLVSLAFLFSMSAGIGLLVLYALGGQTQLEGTLLGLSLGGIGIGLGLWGRGLFPVEVVTEERGPHGSDPAARADAERILASGERSVTRRRFLSKLLGGAVGAFAVAMVFPLRSLGPSPRGTLFRTAWKPGARLVDTNGQAMRADTLPLDGVVTVFPEGGTRAEDSQAVLVRVDPDDLHLPAEREAWAPDGNVCYSRLCTHAGCPVGLYVAELNELQCPCHQSAFDVTNGAKVVFGPATRPLPQLPIEVDSAGYLVARSDFEEPVGPGFWNSGVE
jgi:ubiquinol-cytochrome c reductase iron-sulfur subunit